MWVLVRFVRFEFGSIPISSFNAAIPMNTDRQTDRQWDRQTERQTDRQWDRQIVRQTDRQTDRYTVRQRDRQTDRQTSVHNRPGKNSMTIIMGCFNAAIPMNLTMLGWSYSCRVCPSCRNVSWTSSPSSSLHVFTATVRPDDLTRPRNTSPNCPYIGHSEVITWNSLSNNLCNPGLSTDSFKTFVFRVLVHSVH